MTLVSPYIDIEILSNEALSTTIPNVVFELPPFSYALVTFDLRHLLETNYNWTYGEDWSISFTLGLELTVADPADPIPMAEQFLSNESSKSAVLEFEVFSWNYTRLRVDILLFNKLYLNLRHLFMNTTSVEIRSPNRAIFGTQDIFVASIV